MREEETLNGVGPLVACSPEVWLLSDGDFEAASKLVEEWRAAADEERKSWTCPECHEVISGQFDTCWRCAGKEPPAASFADNEEA